jgi:hypothetical protein
MMMILPMKIIIRNIMFSLKIDELIFYKSLKTGRWWIEIPFLPDVNNKLKKHTLLPCMHDPIICLLPTVKYPKGGIKPTGRTASKIHLIDN